jgi:hypothetical protein
MPDESRGFGSLSDSPRELVQIHATKGRKPRLASLKLFHRMRQLEISAENPVMKQTIALAA